MIIDGKAMAQNMLSHTKARAATLGRVPRVVAFVTSETPATKSYLLIKEKRAVDAGCTLETIRFPESVSTAELRAAVGSSDADAIIVQLPLPENIDTKEVCDSISVEKDADVLSAAARFLFESGDLRNPHLIPPVVGAVREVLVRNSIDLKGKKAVVIGRGFLVGAPVASWLKQQGAEVVIANRSTENLLELLRSADIIVSGAGVPHLLKPDMVKEGVVLIDAGTSESNGEVVGDADPACAEKCSLFTPVPGGIGPLAVACLFENAVTLAERRP